MSDDENKKAAETATRRKWAKRAALIGVLIGLACHLVPPDYRAVCDALAALCTGSTP